MQPKYLLYEYTPIVLRGLRLVWPVLSALLLIVVLLGMLVAWREGWPMADGVYFSFVTGLTKGYGDVVPRSGLSRFLAVWIGMCGILLAGLVAAVGVQALREALDGHQD